jgi:alpha-beta hydrolase superfamily lysophospholipase
MAAQPDGVPLRNAVAAAAQPSEHESNRSQGVIMDHVVSADGTRIAYDRLGSGPAVLLIGSGPTDRRSGPEAPLAALLAGQFTVYNYDRRGRGDSGDTQPYATDREFEDIAAVIEGAGGSVMCYGDSGGGIIALQAAARGLPITRLAVWEPPYIVPGARPAVSADYRDRQWALREQGRGSDMLELFLTQAVGMPAGMVAGMKAAPFWEAMADRAAPMAYDADMVRDFSMPQEQLKSVTVPTLVVESASMPWISTACQALADVLPDVTRVTLADQPHNVDPAALAPVLTEFFQAAP